MEHEVNLKSPGLFNISVPDIKPACRALNRLASFQHLSKFLQDSSLTRFHIFSPALLKDEIKNKGQRRGYFFVQSCSWK
jgi:hypothetical protein